MTGGVAGHGKRIAVNARQPPALLTAATADVLRKHAPFDAMSEAELAYVAQ